MQRKYSALTCSDIISYENLRKVKELYILYCWNTNMYTYNTKIPIIIVKLSNHVMYKRHMQFPLGKGCYYWVFALFYLNIREIAQ